MYLDTSKYNYTCTIMYQVLLYILRNLSLVETLRAYGKSRNATLLCAAVSTQHRPNRSLSWHAGKGADHMSVVKLPGYDRNYGSAAEWVVVTKLVLRAECRLESSKLCDIRPGMVVYVLGVSDMPEGSLRAEITFEPGGSSIGWLTAVAKGKATLQARDRMAPADAQLCRRAGFVVYSPAFPPLNILSQPEKGDPAALPSRSLHLNSFVDDFFAGSSSSSSSRRKAPKGSFTPRRAARTLTAKTGMQPSFHVNTNGEPNASVACLIAELAAMEHAVADMEMKLEGVKAEAEAAQAMTIKVQVEMSMAKAELLKASARAQAADARASKAERGMAEAERRLAVQQQQVEVGNPEQTTTAAATQASAATSDSQGQNTALKIADTTLVEKKFKRALAASATKLVDLFKEWDTDGNNEIDQEEFRRGMKMVSEKHGVEASMDELDALFALWDPDGSGAIDFPEFSKALKGFEQLQKEEAQRDFQRIMKERRDKKAVERASGGQKSYGKAFAGVKKKVEERQYEESSDAEVEGEWATSKWLLKLGIAKVITAALKLPHRDVMPAFNYVRKLKRVDIEKLLSEAQLAGLNDVLVDGIEALSKQRVASAAVLNDKFQATGKFQMSCAPPGAVYHVPDTHLGPCRSR